MKDLSWVFQYSSTSQELELGENSSVRLQKHNSGALATFTTSTFCVKNKLMINEKDSVVFF